PIANYIVDFFCAEKKLVIEVDGEYHLYTNDSDKERQSWLESQGYKVVRYWNEDVLENFEAVVQHVQLVADE
ncbi:hypothetical protein A2V82_03965, partial [candidate division KSB1 bacterium RBG_16_48_16]